MNDELYVAEVTPEAERYAGFQNLPLHEVGDLAAWLSDPPTKLVTIDDPEVLDELEVRLKERFAGRLYISKSALLPRVREPGGDEGVRPRLPGRAPGLHRRPDHRLRDGENDVELLEWAGFGVAVANAHPASSRRPTVCPSAEEEGVAQVVEALLDSDP